MNATLAVLADFANQSADGKLNILGAFDTIYAPSFPAAHPEMKVVVRFELHPAEADQAKALEIQFRGSDGQKLLGLQGVLQVTVRPDSPAGEMLSTHTILGINGLQLPAAGRYEFVVMINGDIKALLPLRAIVRPQE